MFIVDLHFNHNVKSMEQFFSNEVGVILDNKKVTKLHDILDIFKINVDLICLGEIVLGLSVSLS